MTSVQKKDGQGWLKAFSKEVSVPNLWKEGGCLVEKTELRRVWNDVQAFGWQGLHLSLEMGPKTFQP